MGITTATGGSIRWEIIQNAMSSLPTVRPLRPSTARTSRNSNTPPPIAANPWTRSAIAAITSTAVAVNSRMALRRGR